MRTFGVILSFLFVPLLSLAETKTDSSGFTLDHLELADLIAEEQAAAPAATTVTSTPVTTSTTVPARFTSPLLNKILAGQGSASNLPYWFGFRWNRKIHPVMDDWTEFLYKEIDTNAQALVESMPSDITRFCPNYEKLNRDERILFWVKLTTVLMSFESGFSPEKSYDDTANVANAKDKVISSGLLMMSHESIMPAAYDCHMIDPDKTKGSKDLFDAKKNMACGIRVMNRWVKLDGVIADRADNDKGEEVWKGLARYWGPFRHKMLKKDQEGLWGALLKRVPRWQEENNIRDQFLSAAVTTALGKPEPLDRRIWEASSCKVPHPSMMDERYKKEESHKFSSVVRLMNQTAFCYK